jgi:peptidyl-prolyl cis-trans isomerase A (cyclophilin A)
MHVLLSLILGLSLAAKSHAQMYADLQTSVGLITCELNFRETPRTVANFISLAEGTRQWVDERNGRLSTLKPAQPFYNGIVFHRVINEEGFRIIQAGSKRGDGTDGAGFEFPDEMNMNFPLSYRFDQPYCLAMANSGPNTNGSQFFITGGPIEGLEGRHTVFGRTVFGESAVEAILGSEVDENDRPRVDVTIQGITIRRVGKEAQKFKLSSFKLPTLSSPKFKVAVAPSLDNTNRYIFKQSLYSELLVYATIDPNANVWQKLNSRWHSPSPFSANYYDINYPQGMPITGFRPVIVKYTTDAMTPVTPQGYSLSIENEEGSHVFLFPAVGAMNYIFTPVESDTAERGSIKPGTLQYRASPHHALMAFELDQQKIIYLHLGFDRRSNGSLVGRCVFKVKNFVVTDPETGDGYYAANFTEIGGDKGFSMTLIK